MLHFTRAREHRIRGSSAAACCACWAPALLWGFSARLLCSCPECPAGPSRQESPCATRQLSRHCQLPSTCRHCGTSLTAHLCSAPAAAGYPGALCIACSCLGLMDLSAAQGFRAAVDPGRIGHEPPAGCPDGGAWRLGVMRAGTGRICMHLDPHPVPTAACSACVSTACAEHGSSSSSPLPALPLHRARWKQTIRTLTPPPHPSYPTPAPRTRCLCSTWWRM